jgi:7-cyano-7-deazaguanine synthase in queuosine biosynthesis
VYESLQDTLHFASGDVWNFRFTQASPEVRQLNLEMDPSESLDDPDCVYLFSGGMDSLCAVLETIRDGRRPLLISHSPAFNIRNRQTRLTSVLRQRFREDWSFPHIRASIHRRGSEASDYTQRTRSFLFASLGAVIADKLGLKEACLADNGVVSLNLPINAQLKGTKASRSTHPKFLRLFSQLSRQVLPNAPHVANSLWNRTRCEALDVLKDINIPELVEETNSCSHGRYLTTMQAHCGVCSQCIDRNMTLLTATKWTSFARSLRKAMTELWRYPTSASHLRYRIWTEMGCSFGSTSSLSV